ncbi:MAG: substrate-binding domain-containing protein [Thiotrichales bacterium]|nr:MAG: substrate-binding domain-containing protein [Thiotrichales bacterium]
MRDVCSGQADIGSSTRFLLADDPRESGVELVPVAWDAITIIVHKDNPVNDISLEQLRNVFARSAILGYEGPVQGQPQIRSRCFTRTVPDGQPQRDRNYRDKQGTVTRRQDCRRRWCCTLDRESEKRLVRTVSPALPDLKPEFRQP